MRVGITHRQKNFPIGDKVTGQTHKRERCTCIVPAVWLITRAFCVGLSRQDLKNAALVLTEHNALW
jgi:hypothetical protein